MRRSIPLKLSSKLGVTPIPRSSLSDSMSDETGTRGSVDGQDADAERTTDRRLADGSPLDAELPNDVRAALGRVLGEEPVETLGDWLAEVRGRVGGGTISVEDLCHADDETGHWAELDGEIYDFQCFYDAVVLSALADSPVDIRTESPNGTPIEARATGTSDLTVTPEEAVFSFGVEESVELPADGEPSHADVYAAVCPYVRAFPNVEAYERWEQTVPAATVAMPLAGGTEMAERLVE